VLTACGLNIYTNSMDIMVYFLLLE
jgi:hypothetical protein